MAKTARTLATSVLLVAFLMNVVSLASAVSLVDTSQNEIASSQEAREVWMFHDQHRRFTLNLNMNEEERRKGEPIEADVPVIAGLDQNSLRVVYKGEEIPSEYLPSSRKLIFVMPDNFDTSNPQRKVTVYYDLLENGQKPSPDYTPEWVNKYVGTDIENIRENARSNITEFKNEYKVWLDERSVYEANDSYFYNGSVVYFDEATQTWRYENETQLVNYVIFDNSTNPVVWSLYNETAELDGWITFDLLTKNWCVYNSTGDLQGTYTEGFAQTVYLGSVYSSLITDFVGGEALIDDYTIGNVKAVASGHGDYLVNNDTWVKRSFQTKAYRGSPTVSTTISTNSSTPETAWGSALFNLDGTIFFNNSFYDRHTIDQALINAGLNESDVAIKLNGRSRISVKSESGELPNPRDMNWTNAYDMTSIYNRSYKSGDKLLVIPIVINSRFITLWDNLNDMGFALSFLENNPLTSYVIEAWQETIDGAVQYFVNISANYNHWWYDAQGYIGEIHNILNGDLTFLLTYIDLTEYLELFNVMVGMIEDYRGTRPPIIKLALNWDESLPLKVIIHSPVHNTRFNGKPAKILINVTVEGETLMEVGVRLNNGNRVKLRGTQNIWIDYNDNINLGHFASRGSLEYDLSQSSDNILNITIEALDTNGTVVKGTVLTFIDVIDPLSIVIGCSIGAGAMFGIVAIIAWRKPETFKVFSGKGTKGRLRF